jgi:hypothetical protein
MGMRRFVILDKAGREYIVRDYGSSVSVSAPLGNIRITVKIVDLGHMRSCLKMGETGQLVDDAGVTMEQVLNSTRGYRNATKKG